MVAYSFQKRLIAPIASGTKRQTIRAHGKRRHALYGDMMQLYYGMRTKQCRKIIDDVACVGAYDIALRFRSGHVSISGNCLPASSLDAFAKDDGFQDFDDMGQFWSDTHGNELFQGRLIMWKPMAEVAFRDLHNAPHHPMVAL